MPFFIPVQVLPVQFSGDHIDRTKCRDHVGDHVSLQHLVQPGHGEKAGRAHADAVRTIGSVTDHVETQFAVATLDAQSKCPPPAAGYHGSP